MPQVPVTTKTSLTRAQRRAVLRQQLKDGGSTVWTDVVLNDCLNEALILVRSRYPWVRATTLAPGKRLYDLPADFVRMREVVAFRDADGDGASLESRAHGRVVAGYTVSAGPPMALASALATNTAAHVIEFDGPIPAGETWYIFFESALQDYGDATVVNAGVDTVAQDLCPGELADGLATLLFYAAARVAAYRQALNYVKSAGGDDFPAQYELNLRERDRLLQDASGAPRGLRFSAGLF